MISFFFWMTEYDILTGEKKKNNNTNGCRRQEQHDSRNNEQLAALFALRFKTFMVPRENKSWDL